MPRPLRFRLDGPFWLAAAGFLGFLGVAVGAIGAHALKAQVTPDAMALFRTAWEYHILHALVLGLIGGLSLAYPDSRSFRMAGAACLLGIGLFSGSLYAVSLGAPRIWVHVTPFGGFSLMASWLAICVGAFSIRKNRSLWIKPVSHPSE